MSITVQGLPSSRKTPGNYLKLQFGGAGTSGGSAPMRLAILGNMIATALTGALPSFTVDAGTEQVAGVPNETPVLCVSPDDAALKAGRGSELHLGATAAFALYPDAEVWLVPVAEGGGATKATCTLTLTGTATAAGTVRCEIAGRAVEYGFATGDTGIGATGLAAGITSAINNTPDLPVTAQFVAGTGVVTVTSKHGGLRCNEIRFRSFFLAGTTKTQIATGGGTVFQGMTGVSSVAAKMGGGATADSAVNALANMTAQRYHRIAMAFIDSTNINRVRDHMTSQADVTIMKWEQAVACLLDTLTNCQTISAAVNNEAVQIVWYESGDALPIEVACAVAAGRLNGDGRVGGGVEGENTRPQTNLDGLQLGSIPQQFAAADIPIATEVETALNYGLAPLVPSNRRPGNVQLVRSITSRHKDAQGNLNYAVIDTLDVTVGQALGDRIKTRMDVSFANCNVMADATDGSLPEAQRTVTPKMLKGWMLGELYEMQIAGWIQNVANREGQLTTELDGAVAGRINGEVPFEPVPAFHVFGGNFRQVRG